MLKRLILIAATVAVTLVPATAQASSPSGLQPLERPCIMKVIKAPAVKWIVEDDGSTQTYPANQTPTDYDPENPYSGGTEDDFTVHQDGQVDLDDHSYPC